MIKFADITPANKPKTTESGKVAYLYAFILVVFALSQLFTFDEFTKLFNTFSLPGGEVAARLVASMIVICEVFALPFLLRLKLSSLMRIVSMVMGWLVPLIWLKLSLWQLIFDNSVANMGFLGTIVTLVPGLWTIFICLAIGLLAAWASWGLWPLPLTKKTK